MKTEEILALYDLDERRRPSIPGMRREVDGPVVRMVMEREEEGQSFISYADLTEQNADEVIRAQIAYFRGLGHRFEWATYSHDRPADMAARLLAHGFAAEEAGSLMALEVAEAPPRLLAPMTTVVRRLEERAGLEAVRRLLEEVWEEDFAWFVPRMSRSLGKDGYVSIYVAYVEETPASAGWIFFPAGSRFAGLFGGTTLPHYRGQGLYTALLAARLQEARQRGRQFLIIDAGEMSRPIVEKQGFRLLAETTPYLLEKE